MARVQTRADADRRVYRRRSAAEFDWISKVRLKYGPALSLLDLSAGGLQLEIDDHWLRLDSTVVVEIVKGTSVITLPSRVVRWNVTGIAKTVRYRGALQFKRLLEIPEAPARGGARAADLNPLRAHARLVAALGRSEGPGPRPAAILSPRAAAGDALTTVGAGAMAAALAMLDSPAGQRGGVRFARELSGLFNEVAEGVEARETSRELLARLERRLCRVAAARSVTITDAPVAAQGRPTDAVYFDAPSTRGPGARKILVQFADEAAPEEWQFQLLKTSGHLVSLVDELESRRRAAETVEKVEPAPVPADQPAGCNKIVVRFEDGRLLKGYCQDFLPARGHFHLCQSPNPTSESRVLVSIGHLKAVFFVRNFEGNPQ